MEPIKEQQYLKGYEIRERIGTGGFGAVYRAYQTTVGREVAIKVILPGVANHPDFIRRFETEAQLIARLEHLHIVPLHDYWRDPDGAYLVMRWLKGGSLREALQQGTPYDLSSAVVLIDQITSALDTAHRNQIVHRDLKPANILLDEDGNAYLADFGIAKDLTNTTGSSTGADVIVGSLDYISPEQARSEAVTPRTDIYSLGVVLYEMLTGQHPFPNLTSVERLYKHLNEPLPLIIEAAIPDEVNTVIQKATAKNPLYRYSDVLEMAAAFQAAAGLHKQGTTSNPVEILTLREQEILQLVVKGMSNKEIAQKLTFTVGTVKWYVSQVYKKLNVRSRVQAMVRARELNLLTTNSGLYEHPTVVASIPTEAFQPTNPYKGLRAFKSADHEDFFGQEKLTDKLVKRLGESGANSRFLAVVGPSGSGKSSLVKAGLIPALWRGDLPGSERWFLIEMLPGSRPLDELEIALIRIAANQASHLKEQLQRDKHGLIRAAQLILPDDNSDLVIVIDQFEEVFTLVEDEDERIHFLNLLHTAVTDPRSRVRVIITLRADFYDRPLHYPEFGDLVRSRMETILPLSAEGLERAISQPAQRVGVTFEAGLVANIIQDINYQPGALPLLQYALTELFEQRQGRSLTHETYQAIGRTVGALAKRAEEIYAELTDAGQEIAHQMFLRLVTLGEGVEDTRRRVPRSELLSIASDQYPMDEVIDTFAAYRLLSLDHDPATRAPTVEVAHEALLREWNRLREWLKFSREDIKMQRQLAAAAAEWHDANRELSFLVTGSRLEQLEKWAADTELALTPIEREFLTACLTERQRQQATEQKRQEREKTLEQRSRQFLRSLVGVFAAAALIAVILSLFAFNQSRIAGEERNNAQAERDNAQSNFLRAERIRLAAQAQAALSSEESGEVPALLALRSLEHGYSAEADAALVGALTRGFTQQRYIGHQDAVTSATFSPDGRYILTSSLDSTVRLWDTQTGQEIRQFIGHNRHSFSTAFSPDGRLALTGGLDRLLRVWDVETGEPRGNFIATPYDLHSIVPSTDGKVILLVSKQLDFGSDMIVQLRDTETYLELNRFAVIRGSWAALSPDSRTVVSVSHTGEIQVWDLATETILHEISTAFAWTKVAFAPNGSFIAAVGANGEVVLWDTATWHKLHEFTGHDRAIATVTFSPDSRSLATGGDDNVARVWDVETGAMLRQFVGHRDTIRSVMFSPDQHSLLTSSFDGTARLWNIALTTQPLILQGDNHETLSAVAFSPDGQRLLTASNDNRVQLWDIQTETTQREFIQHRAYISTIVFSPDGQSFISVGKNSDAFLWNIETDAFIPFVDSNIGINTASFSPDGTLVITAGAGGSIILRDALTTSKLHTLTGHNAEISSVVFSPDGQTIVSASIDGMVRLWEVATRSEIYQFSAHGGESVTSVAFSPDGRYLITGSMDYTAKLWDVATRQEVRQFAGHTGVINSVAFSPDGRYLLTGSTDRTARLWEVETGLEVRRLTGHSNAIADVAYAPNGQLVATASADGTARIWLVNLEDVVALACDQLPRDFTDQERETFLIMDEDATCPMPAN